MIHQAFAGALFEPRAQIVRAVDEQPLAAAAISYLLAGFSWVLSDFLIHQKTQVILALFMDTVVYLTLLSALLGVGMIGMHFFAELLGGKTDFNALFWGVMQSTAPLVFLVPLALAAQTLGTAGGAVYLPGKIGIFLWVFACQSVAVSEASRLSVARGCFVFFLGYGTALIVFVTASVLLPLAVIAKAWMVMP